MSSGGDKRENVTNVSQSGPPAWAQGYYQDAFNRAGQIAYQPYRPYTGSRVADFTDDQYAAMDKTRELASGGSSVNNANNYVARTLSGQGKWSGTNPYAGKANPYLNKMIDSAQGDVTDAYRNSVVPEQLAQFNAGGAYGGTAHMAAMSQSNRDLAGELGDVSTQLRGQDYYNQQQLAESQLNRDFSAWDAQGNRQLQAAGMAPGLDQARYYGADRLAGQGATQQNWLQSLIDTNYGDFVEQRDWNKNQLGVLTNALASINGGTTGSQSSSQANPNYRSAGQNATIAALYSAAISGMFNN